MPKKGLHKNSIRMKKVARNKVPECVQKCRQGPLDQTENLIFAVDLFNIRNGPFFVCHANILSFSNGTERNGMQRAQQTGESKGKLIIPSAQRIVDVLHFDS